MKGFGSWFLSYFTFDWEECTSQLLWAAMKCSPQTALEVCKQYLPFTVEQMEAQRIGKCLFPQRPPQPENPLHVETGASG